MLEKWRALTINTKNGKMLDGEILQTMPML